MDETTIIEGIKSLLDKGVRLVEIETALGMPQNCLSGMVNRSREIPKKWIPKLEEYIEAAKSSTKIPDAPVAPPAGLSKTQQIRWHRQKNQTLL